MSTRRVSVVESIMSANDRVAQENRALLDAHGVHAINVMASPGAGKTTLIVETIKRVAGALRIGVIEGDLASDVDARTVRETGAPAVQINTGGNCHLDAPQLQTALHQLPLDELDVVFIENVGNLICPVGFALGEHTRLGISSIPEGDDKPLKYPTIFAHIDALVVSKLDLLPYVPFDLDEFSRLVRTIRPEVEIMPVSCVTGKGVSAWIEWLTAVSKGT